MRADSECRYVLRAGAKVKIWEPEPGGWPPAPPFVGSLRPRQSSSRLGDPAHVPGAASGLPAAPGSASVMSVPPALFAARLVQGVLQDQDAVIAILDQRGNVCIFLSFDLKQHKPVFDIRQLRRNIMVIGLGPFREQPDVGNLLRAQGSAPPADLSGRPS
jgi:hypothetical protein